MRREALALHRLDLARNVTYLPRLRERRIVRRRVERRPLLFLGYLFVQVVSQWYSAGKSPGVANLFMAGDSGPAKVPDPVIAEIRARERNGLVDLPPPPQPRPGEGLRVASGPFAGRLAVSMRA